jgi:integrase
MTVVSNKGVLMKQRTGYTFQRNGQWFGRVTYTDQSGKRRNLQRKARNITEAKELVKDLIRQIDSGGEKVIESERMLVSELLDYFKKNYLIQAVYVGDRKVAGRRSLEGTSAQIEAIRQFFGRMRLKDVRYGHLETFRRERFSTPTKHNKQRSISTVNKELSLVRRIFNVALRQGWIDRNPFSSGESLISIADETKRERILSVDEEERLLAMCVGRRAHLKPLLICALDTGMRRGELLKLTFQDVDFLNRIITIRASYTKTLTKRIVPMSDRVYSELESLYINSSRDPQERCFGLFDNVKKSFTTACRLAGVKDFRFHDCRHTFASRLAFEHVPLAMVGRLLGHTQAQTTLRYTNVAQDMVRDVANVINRMNGSAQEIENIHVN